MILVVPKIIILLAVCIKYVILLKWSRPYNASRWLMGWLGESWSRHSSVLTRALALSPGRRPPKGKVFKFAAPPPHLPPYNIPPSPPPPSHFWLTVRA